MGRLVCLVSLAAALIAVGCASPAGLDGHWISETQIADVPPGELMLVFDDMGGRGQINLRRDEHNWPWRSFRWLRGEGPTLLVFPEAGLDQEPPRTLIYGFRFKGEDALVVFRDPSRNLPTTSRHLRGEFWEHSLRFVV